MLEELGTRQERLSIGLPVWIAAVAMAYTGVPWLVVAPLGVVSLVLIAGSVGSAKGATLTQLAVAAPLLGGHVAVAFPQSAETLSPVVQMAEAPPSNRPPLPTEVAEAPQTAYEACAYWGARDALATYCPGCRTAPARTDRREDLSRVPDAKKCERIFTQTLEYWRSSSTSCETLARQQPRIASEIKDFHSLCAKGRNPRT